MAQTGGPLQVQKKGTILNKQKDTHQFYSAKNAPRDTTTCDGIQWLQTEEAPCFPMAFCHYKQTSRERPKSAPYLRLKIEKGEPFGLCEIPACCKKGKK